MIKNRILNIVFVCLLVSPLITAPAVAQSNRTYSTVYAHEFRPTEKHARGTLQGDFVWAAQSSNIRTAVVRWKNFLLVYGKRELDSGVQARLISIAKYELMRIHYLLGNRREGDRILKELDPLKLFSTTAESTKN